MVIATTFFLNGDPKSEEGLKWLALLQRWIRENGRFSDLVVISDQARPPAVEADLDWVWIEPGPESRGRPPGQSGLWHDFVRKGVLLLKARYYLLEDVLYLDADAWAQRDPEAALHQAEFTSDHFGMAIDAGKSVVVKPDGWAQGRQWCGGIIFIGANVNRGFLIETWNEAMRRVEIGHPGHYLQEQMAFSAIMNQPAFSEWVKPLPNSFNVVPHLAHMHHPSPVIHHHHGPHKWRLLQKD